MNRYYLLYCNDLYTTRSGIQIPFICDIAVADRFTRTDITFILKVTLPRATLLKTYLEYLYISRRNRVCIPIFFNVNMRFRVFSISKGSKKLSFADVLGL